MTVPNLCRWSPGGVEQGESHAEGQDVPPGRARLVDGWSRGVRSGGETGVPIEL